MKASRRKEIKEDLAEPFHITEKYLVRRETAQWLHSVAEELLTALEAAEKERDELRACIKNFENSAEEVWDAAHEAAPCGHARANYKDPKYGTPEYKGEERCEVCFELTPLREVLKEAEHYLAENCGDEKAHQLLVKIEDAFGGYDNQTLGGEDG